MSLDQQIYAPACAEVLPGPLNPCSPPRLQLPETWTNCQGLYNKLQAF